MDNSQVRLAQKAFGGFSQGSLRTTDISSRRRETSQGTFEITNGREPQVPIIVIWLRHNMTWFDLAQPRFSLIRLVSTTGHVVPAPALVFQTLKERRNIK
eukprot:s1016_g6.t1